MLMKNIFISILKNKIELLDGNKWIIMLSKFGTLILIKDKKSFKLLQPSGLNKGLIFLSLIMEKLSLKMLISLI